MKAPATYWFGRQRFGWGYGPRTWQGWVATLVYVVLMLFSKVVARGDHALHVALLIGLSIGFLAVLFWKLDTSK